MGFILDFWKDLNPIDGEIIELGVWDGVSFNEMCKLFHPRKVYGFDWFHGLPDGWSDPAEKGIFSRDGKPPGCPDNGEFIIGKVEDTLPGFRNPISLCHFDLDLYGPTKFALETLNWQSGSILIFDEIDGELRNINHEQKAFREWNRPYRFIGKPHPEAWCVRLV
jgi:S-adenosyl-L-methionine methyltransferase